MIELNISFQTEKRIPPNVRFLAAGSARTERSGEAGQVSAIFLPLPPPLGLLVHKAADMALARLSKEAAGGGSGPQRFERRKRAGF